jgi:hypothetical protein
MLPHTPAYATHATSYVTHAAGACGSARGRARSYATHATAYGLIRYACYLRRLERVAALEGELVLANKERLAQVSISKASVKHQ